MTVRRFVSTLLEKRPLKVFVPPPKPTDAEILAAFDQLLEQHRGQIAAPESSLPFKRHKIQDALKYAVGNNLPASQILWSCAARLALPAFLPDEEANLVKRLRAEPSTTALPLTEDQRRRAKEALANIQKAQSELLCRMCGDFALGAPARYAGKLAKNPFRIGSTEYVEHHLDRALFYQEVGVFGYCVLPAQGIFLFVWLATVLGDFRLLLRWQIWLFIVSVWCAGLTAYVTAHIARLLANRIHIDIVVAVALVLPFLVLALLFYLLLAPFKPDFW